MSLTPRSAGVRRLVAATALSIVAAVGLSGCGADLHPGVAAKVNGTSITAGQADDLTHGLCSYLVLANKQAQQQQQFPVASIRSATSLGNLIYIKLMNSLFASHSDLTVYQSDVAAAAAQTPIPEGLSTADRDAVKTFFYDYAKAQLEQSVLAANILDSSKTDSRGVTYGAVSGSEPVLAAWSKKADVDVNPEYGTWNGSTIVPGSGSLSEPVSTQAAAAEKAITGSDVSGLPADQICG